MTNYIEHIRSLENPSFSAIRKIAVGELAHLSREEKDNLYYQLKRGTALLNSHEQMCMYLRAYGPMHRAKLVDAFNNIPDSVFNDKLEVIDWGCGQAIGTLCLLDHLMAKGFMKNVEAITLVEPSEAAIERALLHVSPYVDENVEVRHINDFFENVDSEQLAGNESRTRLHIFSNILDVEAIDLKHLSRTIDARVVSDNLLICVGPLNPTNTRIDAFLRYFNEELIEPVYQYESSFFNDRKWTYKARVYKLEKNEQGHLIPIEYYPPVQFLAAYELDAVKDERKTQNASFDSIVVPFEVAAPFDLGASVYEDVHPLLAVMNNLICRGLPTKCSPYIEEVFEQAFGLTNKVDSTEEIIFRKSNSESRILDRDLLNKCSGDFNELEEDDFSPVQLQLSPVAIARFQKVLLEALITGHLNWKKATWRFLVEEKDVPFAHVALDDFKRTFQHLSALVEDSDLQLPEIELTVINQTRFKESGLHLGRTVFSEPSRELMNTEFDFVLSLAVFQSVSDEIENFSKFKAANNCYFNVLSAVQKRAERVIYTSELIKFKNLVTRNVQGQFTEVEENKANLRYFLQYLFRKVEFRPGQLPILDRALRNLPVIGLLPTGGGKSLTYQIATLLQPGVAMVVDPLKSLMKDQYDGLINSGIDCAIYINSSLTSDEKKDREKVLESSQTLFVFLSPERLSMSRFRERLANMHNYNVYFSYGVIDEVHCVSEWGHDFRFSYLHLGRNLYNYVRAKEGEISLFGLTATASFDVLADVERELSGSGAFDLDADVIVRYENTNRLELQYKVERVQVEFEPDSYFDRNGNLESHLPKALNITNHWPQFNSKSDFLSDYVFRIPRFLREIQSDESIDYIKQRFIERQNNEEGTHLNLSVEMANDYYKANSTYSASGIVFCPHVAKTGLSVDVNKTKLKRKEIVDVASFTGRDNDDVAIENLELFRNNGSPLMVATKAFGMGIDKPNVRFTVNINYSSSLESFVQEAGRAGRDRRMAVSSILISDYSLMQIDRRFDNWDFPVTLLKGKWFHEEDLEEILDYYGIEVPDEYLLKANPSSDIVKLHCKKDNRMFAFRECSTQCSEFNRCDLRKTPSESRGWKTERELISELTAQGLNLGRRHFQYLNADYQTVMFFFNQSFKGDIEEKKYMHRLLNTIKVQIEGSAYNSDQEGEKGFLSALLRSDEGVSLTVYVPHDEDDYVDLQKAIYRMTCIELIQDFTHDYDGHFRIVTRRKKPGEYFEGLKRFLLRYFTAERANKELYKASQMPIKKDELHPIEEEIYKCLAYLTEFVYDKISEKRKRAIDDMRDFCIEGIAGEDSWLEKNERLKEFIFYYFNSKYAKTDYIAENGEEFSLVNDTDGGKESSEEILFKYLRVIEDEIVGIGTPLDNVKHLHGAVRLIGRSLTDSNPALSLLEVFCLSYLGTRNNIELMNQLALRYSEGMTEFSNRLNDSIIFWSLFERFNEVISNYLPQEQVNTLIEETTVLIHINHFNQIKNKYLHEYE